MVGFWACRISRNALARAIRQSSAVFHRASRSRRAWDFQGRLPIMGALAADSRGRSADPCGAFRLYIASTLEESMDPTARTLEIENFRWLNRTKKWELLNRMGVCHYCLLFSTGKLESEEREQSREDVSVPLVSSTCKNIRYP